MLLYLSNNRCQTWGNSICGQSIPSVWPYSTSQHRLRAVQGEQHPDHAQSRDASSKKSQIRGNLCAACANNDSMLRSGVFENDVFGHPPHEVAHRSMGPLVLSEDWQANGIKTVAAATQGVEDVPPNVLRTTRSCAITLACPSTPKSCTDEESSQDLRNSETLALLHYRRSCARDLAMEGNMRHCLVVRVGPGGRACLSSL
jgi:hypothetical protein